MITRTALLLALAPLSLGARDDPLAGRTSGEAVDCIDIDRVQGPEVRDARTILYRQNARRVWRTSPDGSCSRLRPGDGLNVEIHGRKLCRGDRFRVRSAGYLSAGVCRFAGFVPYDVVPSSAR